MEKMEQAEKFVDGLKPLSYAPKGNGGIREWWSGGAWLGSNPGEPVRALGPPGEAGSR